MIRFERIVEFKEDIGIAKVRKRIITPLFYKELAPAYYRWKTQHLKFYFLPCGWFPVCIPITDDRVRKIGYWSNKKGNQVKIKELEQINKSYDYIGHP